MSDGRFQYLTFHLKDDIKIVETIKSLLCSGWSLPNTCKVSYEKYFYDEEISEINSDSGEVNIKTKDVDGFYKEIKDIFDNNDYMNIKLLKHINHNLHSFSFDKKVEGKDEYTWYPIYKDSNIPIIKNIIFLGINSDCYHHYSKPIEWDYWESLVVPQLIEDGIDIKKVEFVDTIGDNYLYHKFKHYNKKDDGSFEIVEELHYNRSCFTIEIDGLKIKTKDDFINEVVEAVKENYYNVNLLHDYMGKPKQKTLDILNHDISSRTHREFKKVVWKDLKYSKEYLKDDFDEIAELIKKNGIILDEKDSNGKITHVYCVPSQKHIRKVGNKSND